MNLEITQKFYSLFEEILSQSSLSDEEKCIVHALACMELVSKDPPCGLVGCALQAYDISISPEKYYSLLDGLKKKNIIEVRGRDRRMKQEKISLLWKNVPIFSSFHCLEGGKK